MAANSESELDQLTRAVADLPFDDKTIKNIQDSSFSFDCQFEDKKTGKDILEHFIKSGLHGAPWPKSNIVVCLIHHLDEAKKSKPTVFIRENTLHGEHGEAKLITYIEKVGPTNVRSITIYSNYSPCNTDGHMCSTKLQELREKLLDSNMLIKFSALYKLIRPSCVNSSECKGKHKFPTNNEESQAAYDKLRILRAMPLAERDWKKLIKLLKKYNEHQEYDQQDLNEVRYGKEYGTWRDEEDKRMLEDFIESTRASNTENTQSTPQKTQSAEEPSRPSKGQATGGTTDVQSLKRDLFKEWGREYI